MAVIRRTTRIWAIAILLVIAAAMLGAFRLRQTGLSTRRSPGPFEAFASKQIRAWLVPATARNTTNPLPGNAEILKQGMDHWADHCATCHANNGSGDTEMGRNFYPPAPDMRNAETQSLSDGELYYIISQRCSLDRNASLGRPALGQFRLSDMGVGVIHSPSPYADTGRSCRDAEAQPEKCNGTRGRTGRGRLP